MKTVELWINGEWRKATSSRRFEDLNPVDDSVFALVEQGNVDDIQLAVSAAAEAFTTHRKTVAKVREAYLIKAAELLEERRQAFVDVLIDETGSSVSKANFEVGAAVSILRAAAGSCRFVAGKTMPSDAPGRFSMSIREPLGVVAAITPFNVPLSKGVRLTASPIALGNTVVLLPSEHAPMIAKMLAELYCDAGVPSGVFNMVPGFGEEIGDALTTHEAIKVVTFTGSTRVGRHIQRLCGEHGKRVTLELGGKSPLVVLSDADLDKAVAGCCQGMFTYQGQICMGASRIYVANEVLDEFSQRFTTAANRLGRGDLRDQNTMIGPIISERQRQRVRRHISDAMDKGAQLLAGNTWEKNVCSPTILSGVTSEMEVCREETFGPVTSLYPIADIDEAIARANDSDYGLSAAIYTENLESALRFIDEVAAGMVHVNASTMYAEPHVPFGGVGDSGFGREGTEVDIDLMTEWKWATIQR